MAWSFEDREMVMQRYRETGSTEIVREEYGVPQSTLFSWLQGKGDPFDGLDQDGAMVQRVKLAWNGVDKALIKLIDRIENGEVKLSGTREVKGGLSAKDLCTAIGVLQQLAARWEAKVNNPNRGAEEDIFAAQSNDVDSLEELLAEKKRRLGRGSEH